MSSNYPKVHSISVRILTDKPVRKTPYQVKGVLMRQFKDKEIVPMLDGSYRDKFLYPRVQVKILNEQIYLIGIGEGVDPIKLIISNLESLDFGNITFKISETEIEEYEDHFQPLDKEIRYQFVTPWIALNQTTGNRYRTLKNEDRHSYLNNLLGQNIVFMAREMGLELEKNIFTKLSLPSLFPKSVDENNWGAFDAEFSTNFLLPNYLGIGNGITRGYGTVLGLYNTEDFSLEELEKTEDNELFSDFEEIDVNKVPRPKNTQGKSKPRRKNKFKRSKKILSEEFDIEEDKNHSKKDGDPKSSNRREKQRPSNNNSSKNEINFNSEEYHKKQHTI